MKHIFTFILTLGFVWGQFGEIDIIFDNRLLKVQEQQNIQPLKNDIIHFIQNTRWDEDYSDLSIPLQIQFIFEGVAQKGSQDTYLSQVLISNGSNQRYFDKSVQFPYGQGGTLFYDPVQFDPLSSFLSFYADLILAGEIDTYEPLGGTRVYELAREIALKGISSDFPKGWSERASLVDDMSGNFGLRKARFSYFYAMDLLKDGEMDGAVAEFKNMIKGLNEVYDRFSKEHYTTLFLKAHANDLSKALQLLGQKEMLRDMMDLDPENMAIYEEALN